MTRKVLAWCAFLTLLVSAAPARASTITPGDTWYEFLFGAAGSYAGACTGTCIPSSGGNSVYAPAAPWTFTGAATLTVTDAFNSGDSFKVFDNLVELGTTPWRNTNSDCGSDPAWCSQDHPYTSSGVWELPDGGHSITIQAVDSPFGIGAGYFQADPVPEPASLLLFGTGALGLVARYRRRREQHS